MGNTQEGSEDLGYQIKMYIRIHVSLEGAVTLKFGLKCQTDKYQRHYKFWMKMKEIKNKSNYMGDLPLFLSQKEVIL